MAIVGITLRHLEMPLVVPYRLSYRTFEAFEPFFVEVHDEAGREFARGLVNFSGEELGKLVGRPSSDIRAIFGGDRPDEVIHRDNMVLL